MDEENLEGNDGLIEDAILYLQNKNYDHVALSKSKNRIQEGRLKSFHWRLESYCTQRTKLMLLFTSCSTVNSIQNNDSAGLRHILHVCCGYSSYICHSA